MPNVEREVGDSLLPTVSTARRYTGFRSQNQRIIFQICAYTLCATLRKTRWTRDQQLQLLFVLFFYVFFLFFFFFCTTQFAGAKIETLRTEVDSVSFFLDFVLQRT